MDIRRRAASRYAEHNVGFANLQVVDATRTDVRIVLDVLGAPAQGCIAARNDALDHLRINQKRGWAFGGVDYAQPTAGAGSDVDEPTAALQALRDQLDRRDDLRLGTGDRRGNALVLRVHHVEGVIE